MAGSGGVTGRVVRELAHHARARAGIVLRKFYLGRKVLGKFSPLNFGQI
jgi:hypothetical protein